MDCQEQCEVFCGLATLPENIWECKIWKNDEEASVLSSKHIASDALNALA